jgi:outer membrane protein assembly factor BamB
MKTRLILLVLLIICISCGTNNKPVSDAQNERIIGEVTKIKNQSQWLQFRGDGAMGVAPDMATPPTDFGTDKNVLWKIETPEGFSSPCICEDNLIITGFGGEKKYYIWNINRHDGSVKWKKEILVDTLEYVHPVSSPATATPASDGENIYCYFPPKGLICLDFESNIIWESAIEFEPVLQGSGTSPIVYKEKVILNHDNLNDPKLMVFNKANGELIWESGFDKFPFLSSSWSTPAIWNNQIIIHRINNIMGFDIETGKLIWRFDIATTGCSTPVIIDNTLFVNAWMIRGEKSLYGEIVDFNVLFVENDSNDDGILIKDEFPNGVILSERPEATDIKDELKTNRLGWGMVKLFDEDNDDSISAWEWENFSEVMNDFSNHGLVAIELGDTGNITLSSKKWKIPENVPETPSVLVKNGLVYMIKNGGLVTCVDTESGDIIYTKKIGTSGSYLSSPLYANGNIFISSYNGRITILKEGNDFEIINQIDLGESIGASPVALEDKLYVRTASHLYAFK